jgi:thiamine-monophosphate kinase
LGDRTREDDLIARHFGPIARHPGAHDLLDDAAVITPDPGFDLVVSKDALVSGIHFFTSDPPWSIAAKALRVNLSDLAAKAAEPVGFLLAIALPQDWSEEWVADFARGLGADAARYRTPLLGGDTVKTPGPLTLSVTVIGRVPHGTAPRRTGARDGDLIYASGTIGDAALGLRLRLDRDLERKARDGAVDIAFLLDRYLHPQPRLEAIEALRACATATMDISDGLVGDLAKLLHASGVGATVEAARIPLSPSARALVGLQPALLETALTGGDDYEILCTVPPAKADAFESGLAEAGLAVARIGAVAADEPGLVLTGPDGARLTFAHGSYSHF